MEQNRKRFEAIELLIIAVIMVAAGLALWRIYDSRQKAASSPQKTFSSYDDCVKNGGEFADITPVGGDFSPCIGVGPDNLRKVFLQYSAQNLPRINERKTTQKTNTVNANGSKTTDLISFLQHDDEGCEGYYKILKEVPNRFAKLNYGCSDDKTALEGKYFIIAIKLGDGWSLISPTNNMNDDGVPSCLLVDMFKVSKSLADKCFENTGYNDGSLRTVSYL